MSELPQITSDFLDENEKLCQTVSNSKKGGPYSKKERDSRREEVYRLCFEYGYTARKISELIKINRNTINGDIQYWYDKVVKNWNGMDPEFLVIKNIERLELLLQAKQKTNCTKNMSYHIMEFFTQ